MHLPQTLRDGVIAWMPDGQDWAVRMADVLVKANKAATAARAAGKDRLGDADLERIRVFYRSAALQGLLDNEHRRTAAAKRARTLARRFRDNEQVILRFATDLAVGFTKQRVRTGDQGPQAAPSRVRVLAHPTNPRPLLHHPLLPRLSTQPRHAGHRRHQRRPRRKALAATDHRGVTHGTGLPPLNGHPASLG